MQTEYEALHHKLESDYWFFAARRDMIKRLIKGEPRSLKVVEIGCSSGVLLTELKTLGFSSLAGVDISSVGIDECKKKGLEEAKLVMDTKLPFADKSFDLLISSDVLEHIENDTEALSEWTRVLRPGGKMTMLVPAWMFLWSDHDLVNKHFRRYEKSELSNKILRAGFTIDRVSYWNITLFFPISIIRAILKLLPKKEPNPKGNLYGYSGLVNWLLKRLLLVENLLISLGINFPFGVSLLVVATKK